MSTKIDLEYPYTEHYSAGYLITNVDNRKMVLLIGIHGYRTTTSYARYVYATMLGQYLEMFEHVDHIDDDKTNDDFCNLQILTQLENNRKSSMLPLVELTCPVCSLVFHRRLTQLRGRKHRIKDNLIACSRSCGYRLGYMTKSNS